MNFSKDFLEELSLSSQIKAAFYNYFYRIFKEPVDKDFMGITEKFIPHFSQLTEFIDNNEINNAISLLKEYEKEEKQVKNVNEFLDQLNIQYTSLYLLGSRSLPTSASVYLSSEKLLKREPWERVCAIYTSRAFKMPKGFNEPEDHIAMELLYMQKLNELILTLIEKGMQENIKGALEEQKKFIEEQMLPWVPEFSKQTATKSAELGSKLYGATSAIMYEFLKYDCGLTQELIEAAEESK